MTAFGKREKEFDKAKGVTHEFEQEINSDDEDSNNNDGLGPSSKQQEKSSSEDGKKKSSCHTKVKVSNLAYRTSHETLTNACLRFGTLVEVHLVLDKDQPEGSTIQNSGRAYVTFDSEESAQACIDGLTTLDGRSLRVNMAAMRPKTPNSKVGGGGGGDNSGAPVSASLLNKMMQKDISTICFRCGGVGHIEANCPNPAKPKPCTLCGMIDHEQKMCPSNRICFNCGLPGHVSRDCTMRRGLPRRMVCGICFQSGHHRLQCRNRSPHDLPTGVLANATCMTCGERGHFLCKDLRWFYGLRGQSCFNCGGQGHSGYDCRRPTLYQCLQNPETALQEIERAEANSL